MTDIKFSDTRKALKSLEGPSIGDGLTRGGSSDSPLLFLRDERLREGIELLFFGYRDFTADADHILEKYGFGRAHHRVIHFVNSNPGITVAELLSILRITKQSLSRVLKQLIEEGFVIQETGKRDRRQRLLFLTEKGVKLEQEVSAPQRELVARAYRQAGPEAVAGFRQVLAGMISLEDADRILNNSGKRKS